MKRRVLPVIVMILGLCAGGVANADTIRFGAILPLTGPGAMIGTQQMRGIQFAVQQANAAGGVHGNKVEILFEDNQAKPDQSILSFNKLVDLQHVPMIFTAYSGPSLAMAPLATRKKILLVNAGAQADKLATASPYLVNTLPTISDEVRVLSKYLVGEGKTQGAVLYENDAAGIAGRDDFVKYFPEAGGTILSQEPAQFGQTDYRPALLKLADAKPQVMLVSITAGLLQMAQQYKQLGLKFTVAGTTFFADPATIADSSSQGFIHTQVRIDAPPELAAAFQKEYGVPMEFFVRQYYNATQIMLTVADKLLSEGKPLTGENMHDALFQIGSFKGLIPLEFKSNTASVPLNIDEMEGGKDVTIKQINSSNYVLALQLLCNGIVTGCALGIVAVSFSLVYGTTKIFHVAHAGVYTVGGYVAWSLVRHGVPFVLALLLAMVACTCLGALIQSQLYARLERRRATHLVVLIASLGALAVMQNILAAVYTADILQFDLPWGSRVISVVGNVRLTWTQVATVVVSLGTYGGVMWFAHRTILGKRIRAVAANPFLAEITRLRPRLVHVYVMAIASALVCLPGVLVPLDLGLQPYNGVTPLLTATIAMIAGGAGSITGAFVLSVVITELQNMSLLFIPGEWSIGVTFFIFVIFMLFRPTGLFATAR